MSDLRDGPVTRARRRLPSMPGGILATVVKLIVVSLVVGLVLSLIGVNPIEAWQWVWRTATNGVRDLFDLGTGWIMTVLALIATGAIVVLPIWLVTRLLKLGR